MSVEIKVISGVPKGSVLAPILFIMFVNCIDSVCCGSTKFSLFADDLKLYSEVDIINGSNDLQMSIDKLVIWARDWQLDINIDKYSVLGVHGFIRSAVCKPNYFINGTVLSRFNSTRDLGVVVDSGLSFKSHINNCFTKASQRTGVLFHGFLCRDLDFLRKAFVT